MNKVSTYLVRLLLVQSVFFCTACADDSLGPELTRKIALEQGQILWEDEHKGAILLGLSPTSLDEGKLPDRIVDQFKISSSGKATLKVKSVERTRLADVHKLIESSFVKYPDTLEKHYSGSVCQVFEIEVDKIKYICINALPRKVETDDPYKICSGLVFYTGGGEKFFQLFFEEGTGQIKLLANSSR